MAEVLGLETGFEVPSFFSGALGSSVVVILLILVVMIMIAVGIWLFIQYRTYNRKIVLFENIAGQGYQPVFKDKARLIKLGDGGEEILRLKKKKVYRTAYGKKMGKNTYWFAVGQDGYWYNVLLGDLDAKMGMLDIEPIDRDMRYMHVAIRKNIAERYRKINWMEKYGTIMMQGIFLIIIIVGIYFLLDKIVNAGEALTLALQSSDQLNQQCIEAMSKIDAVLSGGSGITNVA